MLYRAIDTVMPNVDSQGKGRGNSNIKQITELEEPNSMGERKGNVAGGPGGLLRRGRSSVSQDLRMRGGRVCLKIGKCPHQFLHHLEAFAVKPTYSACPSPNFDSIYFMLPIVFLC